MSVAAAALLVGALRAGGAVAAPTILYVDNGSPSCSNTGPGSQSQPFCTISAAANAVSAGQTVQVAAGTYPEMVSVKKSGTSGSPIVFTAAPGATVTVSGQKDGFVVSGQSWVTIDGFTVTNTTSYGISVSSSSFVTVSDNHVSYSGKPVSGSTATGIRVAGTTDSLVVGNTADHNTYAGIEVNGSSTRVEVRQNTTFANASVYTRRAPGIRVYSAPGNTVDGNVSHDNEDSGIECYPGANNTLIYNNVSYKNGDHGIDDLTCTGNRIVGNTVYKNVTAGINVEGTSTGATLANNISVDNGIKSPRTHSDIRIEKGSTAGTTLDNDLVYLTTPDTLLIWNSVSYSTLAAFQAASGQEMHGIVADPRWASTAGADFHLTAGSPAIDSANSGVSGWPSTDFDGHARVDDPATPNTGSGPRSYDDRGAFEYQPSGSDLPPSAALSVSPASGTAPLAVSADASASSDGDATPIATYAFDFGDGTTVGPQAGATAQHTFQAAGTYTVKVTVTDTAGLSSTATSTVQVTTTDQPPSAALSVSPVSGTAPLAVSADASASSDGDATPIASYAFDFGDGTTVGPQAGATAQHTFQAAGTYTVKVTVTDTGGLSSTATSSVQATSAVTNLVANPGFETDLSGWNTSGSDPNVSLTRVSGGHGGSWAAQISNTGTTTATSTLNDSPNWAKTTAAGTYTGSIWARADTAGATLKLRFREYNGNTLVNSATTQVALTTSWQQVTVTYTVAAAGTTLDFNAYVSKAAPGAVFYADDASVIGP